MGQNADTVRAMYDAYNARRFAEALEHMDPDVTWDFTEVPDGTIYKGHTEIESFWAMLDTVWESLRVEPDKQTEDGDIVISDIRVVGRGKGSGVEVEHPEIHRWRLRDGKLIEGKTFLDPERARSAA